MRPTLLPTRARRPVALLALVAAAAWAATPAGGASSNVAVTLNVASATNISTTGCQAGAAGVTDFGVVLPGTERVQPSTCDVTFGSSNDTSMLRIYQGDGAGAAMWMPPWGAVDTTFSTDGWHRFVSIDVDTPGWDGAVDAAGRLIVASEGWENTQSDYDGALTAFDASGNVVAGFGTGGTFQTGSIERERIYAMEPLADGSLLAAGMRESANGQQYERSTIWKVTSAGVVDPSWNAGAGSTSITYTGANNERDEFRALAIQPDGRAVAAGIAEPSAGSVQYDAAVARFTTGGVLDTTFGGGDGMVVIDVSGGLREEEVRQVLVQDDGRIVVGGSTWTGTDWDGFVLRLEADGTLDTSFGVNGIKTIPINAFDGKLTDIALDAQQRIVWVGYSYDGTSNQFAAGRLVAANGAEDATFGSAGRVLTTFNTSAIWWGVTVLADGRIMTAGHTQIGANDVATIGRMLPNGSADTSLDSDGLHVETQVGPGENMMYDSFAVSSDGLMYAIGRKNGIGSKEVLVTAYRSEKITDYGTTTWASPATSSVFGACLRSTVNATATWTATGSCTATDADPWKAIPATSALAAAKVATGAASEQNAQARLVFGVAPASSQRPGTYVAPVVFEVIAPAT